MLHTAAWAEEVAERQLRAKAPVTPGSRSKSTARGTYVPPKASWYENSEQARAPHTNGPRDVLRCGALSLLQKPLQYREGQNNWRSTLL